MGGCRQLVPRLTAGRVDGAVVSRDTLQYDNNSRHVELGWTGMDSFGQAGLQWFYRYICVVCLSDYYVFLLVPPRG